MYMTRIDRLVRAYIEEHGVSQKELAEEIGVTRETLRRIRSGKEMSFDTAFLLACKLGVSLDDLYSLTH